MVQTLASALASFSVGCGMDANGSNACLPYFPFLHHYEVDAVHRLQVIIKFLFEAFVLYFAANPVEESLDYPL